MMDNKQKLKSMSSNFVLLLAAIIWGFAFVAQRVGNEYVGPFTFNGVRFALGTLSLAPVILIFSRKSKPVEKESKGFRGVFKAGLISGTILFVAASLQQVGMVETSAGKAAFITGLYIVFVPVFGLLLKRGISLATGAGAILAITGLYFLCVNEQFKVSNGDLIVLVGACFWAFHILTIDHFTQKVDALKLSFVQLAVCSVLSLGTAFIFETIKVEAILQASAPILYGGICSVGIAYTLQIVGQKNAHPSHAAIILSSEALFAVVGSTLLLNEVMLTRQIIGCGLMLAGMLLAQLKSGKKQEISEQGKEVIL